MTTTLTSVEFNSDTAGAKSAAEKAPVVTTEGGRASHVLLNYEC